MLIPEISSARSSEEYSNGAIVDLPVKSSGLRVVQLGSETLNVAFPENHSFAAKSWRSIRLAELASAPVVMLSPRVDPSRPIVEEALRAKGPTTFKITDAGSIIELLDQVVFGQRIGLVRISTQRLLRKGVLQKPLVDGPAVGHALIFRSNDHSRRLRSLIDAVVCLLPKSHAGTPVDGNYQLLVILISFNTPYLLSAVSGTRSGLFLRPADGASSASGALRVSAPTNCGGSLRKCRRLPWEQGPLA